MFKTENKVSNLYDDLMNCGWILEKVRNSEVYAQNLYAAMCNQEFMKLDVIPILKDETWSCSWRSAGGIIAEIRQEGDYLNWYCSGIGVFVVLENEPNAGYVPEGTVTHEIEVDLRKLDWIVLRDG